MKTIDGGQFYVSTIAVVQQIEVLLYKSDLTGFESLSGLAWANAGSNL